jgi:hypothetical protein
LDSSLELGEAAVDLEQLAAIVAGVVGEARQARFHAVDALLDLAGRLGDAVGLAVDQGDDVGDLADGLGDRREAAAGDPAAVDSVLDLGGHRLGLAGQRGDGAGDLAGRGAGLLGELLDLGGDDRERASRLPGPRRLDGGVEREHVGPVGDPLDARRDVLDPAHRLGEAGHPLAELDDEVGQAAEDGDRVLDRGATFREALARLLGEDPGLVGRFRHPRLVEQKPAGHLLERIEGRRLDEMRSETPAT